MNKLYLSILRCAGVAGMAAICLVIPVRARGEPASAAGGNPPTPGGNYAAGESKDVVDSTIGFFEDGKPTEVAELETLPEDPFFDRYVPLEGLAAAWEAADSQELAALAIQAAEAERILLRSRHGLPTDVIWRAAIRVAHTRADKESLQRLARASKRLGKKEYRKPLEAALALAGTSRAADEAIAVNPLKMTEQEYAVLQAYSRHLTAAAVRGDKRYLRDFEHNLEALFPGAPGLKRVLKRLLEYLIKSMPVKPLDPQVTAQLNWLLTDSRFGGIKIGGSVGKWWEDKVKKPVTGGADRLGENISGGWERLKENVKDPRIDIHDIQRAGKKAREDIQRETKRFQTGLSEEAWGETGRVAYPAAAATMASRYARRSKEHISRHDRAVLEPHFGSGTLLRTHLVWGVTPLNEWRFGDKTVHLGGAEAQAQAYGHIVYIRGNARDYSDRDRLKLLIHELTHVKQYERYGSSLANFGYHYFKKYKQANQSYRNNPMEQEAYNAEDRLIASVHAAYIQRMSGGAGSLIGTWATNGRSAIFDASGNCTVRTHGGTATFRYTYTPATGELVGVDGAGNVTRTQIAWLSPSSFDWISPSGRRHYVRHRSQFGLR